MSLMPIYFTTTKLSGKRKSSVRERRLRDDHEKWLKTMGIDKPWKPKRGPLKLASEKSRSTYESVGEGIGNGFVKTTSALSGDYIMNECSVTSISIRDEWTLRWAAVDLKFPIT